MPGDGNPFPAVSVEFECPVCGKFEEAKAIGIPETYLSVAEGEKVKRPSCLSVLDVPTCKEHGCSMVPKKVIVFVLHLTETEREDGVCEINMKLAQYGGIFDSSLVVKHKVNYASGEGLLVENEHQLRGACPKCFVRSLAVFDDPEATTVCEHCGAEMDCGEFLSLNPKFVHEYVSLGGLGKMVRGHFVSKVFHHGVFEPEEGRVEGAHDVTRGMLEETRHALDIAFDAEFWGHNPKSDVDMDLLTADIRTYFGLDEKDFAQEARARIISRIVASVWAGYPEGVTAESDPVWVFLNARMPYQSTDHRVDEDIRAYNSKQPVVNDDLSVTQPGSPHVDLTDAYVHEEPRSEFTEPEPSFHRAQGTSHDKLAMTEEVLGKEDSADA